MNKLGKISAIVLVVAMMLSMVSFTAFAAPQLQAAPTFTFEITNASGNEVTSVKAGTKVYVAAYVTAQTYDAFSYIVECGGTVDQADITTSSTDVVVSGNKVTISWTTGLTATDDTPIATIGMTLPSDASGETTLITPSEFTYSIFADNVFGENVASSVAPVTIEVAGIWPATGFEPLADTNVDLGTSETDAIAALPTTVTVTGDGGKTEVRNVENWTKVATYDAATPGTYAFEGTIVANDDALATIPADFKVTANVVVNKLATTIDDIAKTIQAEAGLTDDDMIAVLPADYDVTVGDFSEKVTIAWALDTSATNDDVTSGAAGLKRNYVGTVTSTLFEIPAVKASVTLENMINYRDLVAKIGDFSYDSLQAAVNALAAGTATGDIVLQNDASEFTDMADATIANDATIDLNGKIYDGNIIVTAGTTTFKGDGIVNGDITGDITVEGGAFYGAISGTVNATGGSFPASTNVIAGAGYHTVEIDSRIAVAENAEEATDKITLEFRPVTGKTGVFDIYLVAEDGTVINEFVSAEFKFANASKTTSGADMLYTIAGTDSIAAVRALKEVNEVGAAEQTWGFAVQDKDDHDDIISAAEIQLGTITFDGYGTIDFRAIEGAVHTTLEATNNEYHYYVAAAMTAGVDGELVIDADESIIDANDDAATIEEAKRKVIVNLNFVNDITAGVETIYNDMEVSIVGENADYEDPDPVAIGDANVVSNTLATVDFTVVAGYRYTVTVKGAGYRTARYTTIVDNTTADDLVLNFWNNVKSGSGEPFAEIEAGVSGLSAKNFLAGDIAMDNIIDKYDLAAVISYFGTYELDKDHKPEYVKYDLNRDGKIDSEDIAYVLYSIGE